MALYTCLVSTAANIVSSSPLVVRLGLTLSTLLLQVYAEGDVGLHKNLKPLIFHF